MNSWFRELLADRNRLTVALAWLVVFIAAVVVYWPGLDGPYLLDDFGSIAPLGDYGGVVDWQSFKLYVFGGNSGPTGRPLALLTFLIDGNNWPTESWPFKRTNLIIHLLNGIALGVLTVMVLRVLDVKSRDIRWIAFVATAIWVLHPFLVSTTLYIVQRMAQLSTLFMFAGLAFYLHGRLLIAKSPGRGYMVMTLAIGVFTLLATLSKENGILLPVLAGVFELTIVASRRDRLPALNRYWAALFIVLPAIVIALYLGERLMRDDFFDIVPPREFSIYERFLTQGRILVEYLQHWYLPKLYTTGVFQDHFIKSTGLLSPITTALSFLLHAAVIALAFIKRRQWPLFALAALFFYASHLLESTVINLELYFEHRNYIAVAFLFLPLVELLYRKVGLRAFGITALAVLVMLGSFTRYSATVWQSLPSMIESSALKAPTSARAQSQWAKLLFYFERHEEALETIERAIENIPNDDPLLLTTRMYFKCSRNSLDVADYQRDADKLVQMPFDSRALKAYNVFAKEVVTGSCPNIRSERLVAMFERMLDFPGNGDPRSLEYSHIQFLIGYTRMYSGLPDEALVAFGKSLDSRSGPSHAMAMAALMASSDYNREAMVLADRALTQLRMDIAEQPRLVHKVRESDILEFQATVRADLATQQDADRSGAVE